MRLVIDAMPTSRAGGVGNYATRVISGLAARKEFDIVALIPDFAHEHAQLPDSSAGFKVEVVPTGRTLPTDSYGRRALWEQEIVPQYLHGSDPELYFGPVFMAPVSWPGPKVVTVHDLAFERHSTYNTPESTRYYSTWARRSAQKAAAIMCISHCTRADLVDRWNITSPTFVTHLAPCVTPEPAGCDVSVRRIAEALGLEPPFGLYVGDTFPRKNLDLLIAAVARADSIGPRFPMVLAVPPSDGLVATARRHHVQDRVRMIGDCRDELLPHLYAAAEFLVYPSLFEGFGLPPLEAMTCGTAVAATNAGAVPEVLQDNALYFEPRDADSIAAAIGRLAQDPALRESLAERGRAHAAGYTWERTTEQTARVLRHCLEGRPSTSSPPREVG